MLVPVDNKDFHKLAGIIQRNIEACNVLDRTDVPYVSAMATLHSAQGSLGVWVDNLDDPHALLILTHGKFGVLNETYCFVNTIYADESHRNPVLIKLMLETTVMHAKAKGCDTIQGSSWLYGGATDIAAMWLGFGAVPQETLYVKHI